MSNKQRAFTLIEIMVVIFIIGVLLSVAVPGWMRTRERSRRAACLANVQLIDSAKDQYALAHKLGDGDAVDEEALKSEYFGASSHLMCQSGGSYTINSIGTPAECSVHGGIFQAHE